MKTENLNVGDKVAFVRVGGIGGSIMEKGRGEVLSKNSYGHVKVGHFSDRIGITKTFGKDGNERTSSGTPGSWLITIEGLDEMIRTREEERRKVRLVSDLSSLLEKRKGGNITKDQETAIQSLIELLQSGVPA